MDEQVFSFRDSVRVVARHPRPLVVLGVIGLVLGLGYAVAVPQLVSANTIVVLPPQAGTSSTTSSGAPTSDVQTDVDIAMSSTVLLPASVKAGERLSYQTLQHRVSVTGLTDELLQVTAKASTASQAERLANAVAARFVSYSSSQTALSVNEDVSGWKLQAAQIQSDISRVTKELKKAQAGLGAFAEGSPSYTEAQNTINSLAELQGNFQLQEKVVESEIQQADLSTSTSGSSATILQSATTAIRPSPLRIPQFGAIGLALGALIGIIAAFAIGRRDRRIRLRDEFARAAGVPVIASVSATSRNKSADLLGMLEHFEPSVSDKANFRRLLDELEVPGRQVGTEGATSQNGTSWHHEGVDLSAIVIDGDHRAVVAAAELPAFAAGLGIPVALIVGGSGPSTEQLSIACATHDPLDLGSAKPNLLTYATAPDIPPDGVALAVIIEIVEPSKLDVSDVDPPAEAPKRRACSVLVISPGQATAEDIQVIALAAQHQGRPLSGVVVADAEQSDRTSGQQVRARSASGQAPRQITALRSAAR